MGGLRTPLGLWELLAEIETSAFLRVGTSETVSVPALER